MAKQIGALKETTVGNVADTTKAVEPVVEPKVVEGLYQAKGGGYDLHVEADSRELAIELVKAYTGLEPQGFVLTQCKVTPVHGTPTLRGGYRDVVVDEKGKVENRLWYERG